MYKSKLIKVFVLLLIGLQSCAIFNKNSGELVGVDDGVAIETEKDILKRIPKDAKHYFDDMRFIPRGSQIVHNYNNTIVTKKDTTIVKFVESPASFQAVRLSVPAFYISDHEVTNGEYLEFVDWVTNYTARKILAQKHPDQYYLAGTDLLKKDQFISREQILLDSLFLPSDAYFHNDYYFASVYDSVRTEQLVYSYTDYLVEIIDGKASLKSVPKSIQVFPNIYCWSEEFPNLEGSASMSLHFTNPAYYNYPVVGINYEQAQAYCDWRTNRLNEAILLKANVDIGEAYFTLNDFIKKDSLNEYGDLLLPSFEIPSVIEWQLAAGAKYIDPDCAFKSKTLVDENGHYLANFGKIVDENNYQVKGYGENRPDESIYTSSVKSFPSNDYQLYDMAGNVAEWTSSYVHIFTDFERYNDISLEKNDSLKNAKIVKGGSWADGPVYLRWRTNTFCDKNSSSSRIGFRVSMKLNHYSGIDTEFR